MVPGRLSVKGQHGFSVAELLVVVAIIGIISVFAMPLFLSFLQAQQLRGAAQEVSTLLNQARQLAIARNASYQVVLDVTENRLRFVRTSDSTPWTGPGTDSSGYRKLENRARLTDVTANPTFNSLGTATGATITVKNAEGDAALNVIVSTSGRIRQCSPGAGCP